MAFKHLLLVIYALVYVNTEPPIDGSSSTEAVQCNMCVDRSNWTNCDDLARPRECSDQLVMATHGFLAQYNINLNSSSTVTDRQFRCFRLELEIDVATVAVFIRGCTYDDSFFCDGWTDNGAKATNCAVCSTSMCERNATGDVDPMTTTTTYLPSESTTTTTVSTIETNPTTQSASSTHSTSTTQTDSTTEKASTTLSATVTQSSPVMTTVTTDEPCIVVWPKTTTTTKVVEEVPSQPNNVTQGEDLTTNATDSARNTPSPSGTTITPAPNVSSTTTETNGVEGKYFGINIIVLVLLVLIGSIFVVKC